MINKLLASSPTSITPTDKPTITTKSSIPDNTPTRPSLSNKDPKASLATSRSSTIPKAAGSILERLGSFSGDVLLEDNLGIDSTQESQNQEDLMSAQVDTPKMKSKPKLPPRKSPDRIRANLDEEGDPIIAAFDL